MQADKSKTFARLTNKCFTASTKISAAWSREQMPFKVTLNATVKDICPLGEGDWLGFVTFSF